MIFKLYKIRLINATMMANNGHTCWSLCEMTAGNNGRDDHEILDEAAISVDEDLWELGMNGDDAPLFVSKTGGTNVPWDEVNSSNSMLQGFKRLPKDPAAVDLQDHFNKVFAAVF